MPDAPVRLLETAVSGRLLDAHGSFGRRDDKTFYGMLGTSADMLALFRAVERLAPHARATLITGAPGTGKTMLAGIVHRLGPCRGGLQIRCLGADDTAERDVLREAARGARTAVTGFVPELCDLSADRQAELLRAIVASADLPVGEGLHVIASTAHHPPTEIASGRLRADLFYRLAAVHLQLPGLDARLGDLPDLAAALLRDGCRRLKVIDKTLAGAAVRVLEERVWHGHVRELQNVLLRAAALTDDPVIGAQTMREACGPVSAPPLTARGRRGGDADEAERARVTAALAACGGNKSAAAVQLGVSRRAFYRLLDRLDA